MKWYDIALKALPGIELLLAATVPGSAAVIPFVNDAIVTAQQIHGDTNNTAKKQLVYDASQAAAATGKVSLDPATVKAITDAVFTAIDGVHAVVKANQAPPTQAPPAA